MVERGGGGSREAHQVKNHTNHQAAAWTHRHVLLVAEVVERNLEAVAAGAGVKVRLEGGVERHVFDFDFVVDGEVVVVGHFDGGHVLFFIRRKVYKMKKVGKLNVKEYRNRERFLGLCWLLIWLLEGFENVGVCHFSGDEPTSTATFFWWCAGRKRGTFLGRMAGPLHQVPK